ncbi:sel1 repeat family protein [Rhizobium sp. TRM96647]|uniref:sel1 repeat family protein n=1 Tax=unclassified Rhizobium TaxID=2613769 RepID=UPI0021E7DF62|nr:MULTISPECIES: sel1 repeat family protein [unclassified Rhizobium]MCV3736615.1 sel1 repeat family protein [Rhizobium sp. TRM96647]MCV3758984.1 sel1 repeat family protein [Rhizobium sp. TRM96650]
MRSTRTRTAGIVFFIATTLVAAAPAGASGLSIEEQCDAAAASRHDSSRNPAFPTVEDGQIAIGVALSACREAYNAGGGARIAFQLARALEQGGQGLAAENLYREAAEGGHTVAMVRYGQLLQKKGELAAAHALYRRSAEAGDRLGAYALGMSYRDGIGTAVDASKAAQWLDAAAAGGYEIAALVADFPQADTPVDGAH